MLGTTDDQHLLGRYVQPTAMQVARNGCAFMQSPAMGLVAQQRLEVTGQGELAQGSAQQFGLPGH
ncbi:hypothetical protein D3C72_2560800 [compost metagenome]